MRALARRGRELGDDGGAMSALAIDHDQCLIGRQSAQGGRTDQGVAVARCGSCVVGRYVETQIVGDVAGIADAGEIFAGNHVDRGDRLFRRAPRAPGTDNQNFLNLFADPGLRLRLGNRGRDWDKRKNRGRHTRIAEPRHGLKLPGRHSCANVSIMASRMTGISPHKMK